MFEYGDREKVYVLRSSRLSTRSDASAEVRSVVCRLTDTGGDGRGEVEIRVGMDRHDGSCIIVQTVYPVKSVKSYVSRHEADKKKSR